MGKVINLYVEKYARYEKLLWLDFLTNEDFELVRTVFEPGMTTDDNGYSPSMLMVRNFDMQGVHEGGRLSILLDDLLDLIREGDLFDPDDNDWPVTVWCKIDGVSLYRVVNRQGNSSQLGFKRYVPKKYFQPVKLNFNISQENLLSELELNGLIEIRSWNVGQGAAVSIRSPDKIIWYDLGCCLKYGKKLCDRYRKVIKRLINKRKAYLIISHWDCDHYKLLCRADKDFLKIFHGVIFTDVICNKTPRDVINDLTNCGVKTLQITPSAITSGNTGITCLHQGKSFALYCGEQRKDHTNKNLSGLLMSIDRCSDVVMLPADHSNHQVWDELYTKVAPGNRPVSLTVPHHGSGHCGGCCGHNELYLPAGCIAGRSVASFGKNNGYGHPSSLVKNTYDQAGFTWLETTAGSQVL